MSSSRALVIAIALLAGSGGAHAATFTVTSAGDAIDIAPGDCVCKSGLRGSCTLRAAVMEANQCPGTDTIYILPTVPSIVLTRSGRGEDLAATGDLDLNQDTIIEGNHAVVDGGGLDRVFSVGENIPLADVVIRQLVIVNGDAQGSDRGGGITNVAWGGSLSIEQSTIAGNRTAAGGGGIYNRHDCTTTLLDTAVLNNLDGGVCRGGGGILNSGGTVSIERGWLAGNTSCGAGGAASNLSNCIGSVCDPAVLAIDETIVDGNTASAGGGVSNGEGCTLTAGGGAIFTDNATTGSDGGAIYNYRAAALLADVELADNDAADDGGAVANYGGTLSGARLEIHDNAAGDNGGGIVSAGYYDVGAIDLVGSNVYRNRAVGYGGGVRADHPATITDCTVDENQAGESGGGLFLFSNQAVATLVGSRLRRNTADRNGGGIAAHTEASVTAVDLEVSDGRALGAYRGGGIYAYSSDLDLERVLVSGNTAARGGGIYTYPHGDVVLRNVTVSGNSATTIGGGLGVACDTFVANNVTITDNEAPYGGGFFGALTTYSVSNTIIGDNYASVSGDDCEGGFTSLGYNILTSTAGCTVTATTGDQFGVSPRLAALALLGGFTSVHGFLSGSPALDRGDNATCEPVDQRAMPRPSGPFADVGAYESP